MLVGADLEDPHGWPLAESLHELHQLALSAGLAVAGQLTQRLDSPHPATYLGKGKVQELAAQRKELAYDLVIFDDELSPSQQRNLEEALGVQVMDRSALILDIFAQRARTHEGRLQVELAQYEYYLPRLTRLWTHLSRQTRGGVGLRGPGETQLESDRRQLRRRVSALRKELEEVRTHRALHRQHRRDEMVPVVALVGYTNAGKSTLLRALTGADVLVEDRLFSTLDPTTRRVKLPSGQEVLLSDTVGFIQKLPAQLVAAFRATLEELGDADLLVHVVDISDENAGDRAEAVYQTLRELDLADKPLITALNKIDLLVENGRRSASSADSAVFEAHEPLSARVMAGVRGVAAPYPDAVAISAARGIGLNDLLERIGQVLGRDEVDITVVIPYAQSELVSQLHKQGRVVSETYGKSGTRMHLRVPKALESALHTFIASE
jgi:GTPase